MNQAWYTTRVFMQFLARDWYLFKARLKTYGINYIILYPLMFILVFAYIQPGVYFGAKNIDLMLFAGNIALTIFSITNNMIIPLLFDLDGPRFIDYQLLILSPRLIIMEQILFATFFTVVIMAPYFPLTYFLLSFFFTIAPFNWASLFIMVLISTIFLSTLNMLSVCIMETPADSRQLWLRVIWPLLAVGGIWVPWGTLYSFSPILGIICLLNPFIYITEGLRTSLIAQNQFFSVPICIGALLLFSGIFILLSFYLFKKKIDHI